LHASAQPRLVRAGFIPTFDEAGAIQSVPISGQDYPGLFRSSEALGTLHTNDLFALREDASMTVEEGALSTP